jgi:rhamnose utilization protein RhaD (predicted bifunctional aldolase and dehydrogenase)
MQAAMRAYPKSSAVLVRRHGVYVWGDTWLQAKTQVFRAVSAVYLSLCTSAAAAHVHVRLAQGKALLPTATLMRALNDLAGRVLRLLVRERHKTSAAGD